MRDESAQRTYLEHRLFATTAAEHRLRELCALLTDERDNAIALLQIAYRHGYDAGRAYSKTASMTTKTPGAT